MKKDLLSLKNSFNAISKNIIYLYENDMFDQYIEGNDHLSYDELKSDLATIRYKFREVEDIIQTRIEYETNLIDAKNFYENSKDKRTEVSEELFERLETVVEINNKYYPEVEMFEEHLDESLNISEEDDYNIDELKDSKDSVNLFMKSEDMLSKMHKEYTIKSEENDNIILKILRGVSSVKIAGIEIKK